jgi:hypothetical protein
MDFLDQVVTLGELGIELTHELEDALRACEKVKMAEIEGAVTGEICQGTLQALPVDFLEHVRDPIRDLAFNERIVIHGFLLFGDGPLKTAKDPYFLYPAGCSPGAKLTMWRAILPCAFNQNMLIRGARLGSLLRQVGTALHDKGISDLPNG